jgi:hypothetical protein
MTIPPTLRLPAKPESFECAYAGADWRPTIHCPTRLPRRARHVATVAWLWSPAHSREDVYHLSMNKHRTHWILWHGYFNEFVRPFGWIHAPYAFGPKPGVLPAVAAFYLLWAGWKGETAANDTPGGPFDSVTDEGVLSAEELHLLAELAWPPPHTRAVLTSRRFPSRQPFQCSALAITLYFRRLQGLSKGKSGRKGPVLAKVGNCALGSEVNTGEA